MAKAATKKRAPKKAVKNLSDPHNVPVASEEAVAESALVDELRVSRAAGLRF